MYAQSVTEIIKEHGFGYHLYADDSQIYKSTPHDNVLDLSKDLCKCISDVNVWMTTNRLKMNNDKTELTFIGTPSKLKSIDQKSVAVDNVEISLSSNVKNLGVILDSSLSMDKAISHIRKMCYLELRKISQIRSSLSEEATKKLVSAFVISKLDYCNSLFAAIPDGKLHRLQQIQNHAARLVKQISKKESITPVLMDLHWLPVKARIQYKILVYAYQCLNEESFPSYLSSNITFYRPPRALRSATKLTLNKPKANLRYYGERSFFYTGPDLWNRLPFDIQNANSLSNFKSLLKTHLFRTISL